MDSRTVNLEIKKRIWPLLKKAGFSSFTARTAWRHHHGRIDVLNFQSFNSYNAAVLGCTSYSLALNLGCYLQAIPPQFEPSRIKKKEEMLLPQEFECHFRGRLSKQIEQPSFPQRDIWYVDPDGRSLGWVMTDVENQIAEKALSWFDEFSKEEFALSTLLSADEKGELWGFGRNPSPIRHYFTGYLAFAAGQRDLAVSRLELALASGSFKSVDGRLTADIQRGKLSA